MWEEFKKFAFKGNLIDMAIGIIMGGAFATVATSFVEDIIMPPLAHFAGGVSWENKVYILGEGAEEGLSPEDIEKQKKTKPVIAYGKFITNLVSFLIIALVMFIVMKKILGSIKILESEPKEPEPSGEEKLLTEIRDLLKKD